MGEMGEGVCCGGKEIEEQRGLVDNSTRDMQQIVADNKFACV